MNCHDENWTLEEVDASLRTLEKYKKPFAQSFEFKMTRGDGEEVVIKKSFPAGADISDITETYCQFLKLISYSNKSIGGILNDDFRDCDGFEDYFKE